MVAREFTSSVSPKGQITLPVEIRSRLHIRPKDRVSIVLHDDGHVTVAPAGRSVVDELFMSLPGRKRPLDVNEETEIAAEEHTKQAARDGL